MRTFHCEHCHNPLYFENSQCGRCHYEVGVLPEYLRVSAIESLGEGLWRPLMKEVHNQRYRKCENYSVHHVCNWMVRADEEERYCVACRLNRVIPNLSRPGFTERWYRLERSKRRLIYSLLKLGLPVHSKTEDPQTGLAFSFMSNLDSPKNRPVVTGHTNGHITINIDEADPALRERHRVDMKEKYRTLLGHFRHEIGHYYWDLLIRDQPPLEAFRQLFGDERKDYTAALKRYYKSGPPQDWQAHYITRYASAHPWEDWAETWAHYLHIVDTLETAQNFGLKLEEELVGGHRHLIEPKFDPYRIAEFQPIIEHWIPLTYALNSLNRSMGLQDLYPFVLSETAIEKLRFVHDIIRAQHDFIPEYVELEEKHAWVLRLSQLFKGITTRFKRS